MIIAKGSMLMVALFFCMGAAAQASPVLFVVRHAEKATTGGNDPELSAAGRERAGALARMLKDAEISTIFTTEFKRSQETAAPIAKATQVTPTIVPAKDIPALVEKLRSLKGNALVVGHADTIPVVVKSLGLETPVSIPENDYTRVFVIVMGEKPQLVQLHYPL